MLLLTSIYLYIIVGLYFWYLWSRRKYYWLSWKMNSLLGLPFLGVALKVKNQETILQFIAETRKQIIPHYAIVWFGPEPIFYVSEPSMMKKIFTSPNFLNKAEYYKIVGKHFGKGLFSLTVPIWNRHRKLIEPAFNINLLKNFIPIFNKEADILVKKLEKYLTNDNKQFNIVPLCQLATLDSSCQTTMGTVMNFQSNQNMNISKSYSNLLRLITKRIFNPLYHFDSIFNLSKWGPVLKESKYILKTFVDELVNRKLKEHKEEIPEFDEKNTEVNYDKQGFIKTHNIFIDLLIEFYKKELFTWDDLENESNIMISAAYETSANTVAYTIICLAMFPEYQECLFQELIEEFPCKTSYYVSSDNLLRLPYLEMCINENMRLMAPVPLVGRNTIENFTIQPENICLPKGTQIVLDIFNMQRDKDIWGDNALTYYPNHFLPENLQQIHKFAFSPFTRGIRTCIELLDYIEETRKSFAPKYGLVWFGPNPVFYVSSPDLMKKILPSSVFINKADYYDAVTKHLGEALFSSKAPVWNMHRKYIEPAFRGHLLKDFVHIFNNEGNFLIKNLYEIADGKTEIELLQYMHACFLDVSCQTTMGKRMKFQEGENADISIAYCNVFKLVATRIFNPLYMYDWIFNLSRWGPELKESQEILQKFIYNIIQERLKIDISDPKTTLQEEEKTNNEEDFTKTRKIFIDVVIDCYRNKQFTWEDLENESNIILASSFESSASTLTNTLSILAMFPQEQERLFEEIKNEFPDKNAEMLPERVQQLPYLDMVINEGMRLLGPIPLVGRTAGADFDLGDGIVLPKGTQVLLDIFNMQRDVEVWGPDAKIFNPEHFSPEYLQTRHSFAFIPFAKGIRSCIGSKYAMVGMKMICAKLIRHYRFSTDFQFKDLQFREDIGLKFVEVPKLRLTKRES